MRTTSWNLAPGRTLASLACGIIVLIALQAAASSPVADPLVARLASVENINHPYPWLLTGGQPDAKALETLAETGVWDVMDLGTATEPREFDERAVAKACGLRYLPVPTTTGDFTNARLTAFRHHLIAHGPKHPLFIHCATGNRVGAALLPWLVLDQGVEQGVALEMARAMGLRDQNLTRRALDYISAHQRPTPVVN